MKHEPIKPNRKTSNKKYKYKEYLKFFDEECKKNAEQLIKETPLLVALYEDFAQQLVQQSKLSKLASETQARITEELENILTRDEQKLLQTWQEQEEIIYEEREQQIFVYGYVMSTLLRYESRRHNKYKFNK